jgi:hypothetical protein
VMRNSHASNRTVATLVFLLTLVVYLATTGGSMATDTMSYEVARNIAEHGSVAMSYNVHDMDAHRGADGRYYSPYGIGHPVYAVPFYYAGLVVERVTGLGIGKPEAIRKAFFVLGNAVAGALTVWLAFLFALRLGGSVRAAAATACTLAFATLLWPYAKMGFNAPVAALTMLWGTYGAWVGVRDRRAAMLWSAGIGFGCTMLVRHELVLATVPVGIFILMESRWRIRDAFRRVVPVAVPVAVAIALTLYYNYARFANPLDTGYLRDGTTAFGSIWTGLVGTFLSPGRALFLFTPVTILSLPALAGLWRRDRGTAALLGGIVAIVVLFYASQLYWDADRSYGPRYLVAVLAHLCLPLVAWFDLPARSFLRRLLLACVVVSVIAQAPGVLVDFSKVGYGPAHADLDYGKRIWTWEGSGFVLNARAAATLVPVNVRYLTGQEQVPVVRSAEARARSFSEQFAFSLDFWWLYLFYARVIPAWLAVGAFALMMAVAAALASALRRQSAA